MSKENLKELWEEIIDTCVKNKDPKYSFDLFKGTIEDLKVQHEKELSEAEFVVLKKNIRIDKNSLVGLYKESIEENQELKECVDIWRKINDKNYDKVLKLKKKLSKLPRERIGKSEAHQFQKKQAHKYRYKCEKLEKKFNKLKQATIKDLIKDLQDLGFKGNFKKLEARWD